MREFSTDAAHGNDGADDVEQPSGTARYLAVPLRPRSGGAAAVTGSTRPVSLRGNPEASAVRRAGGAVRHIWGASGRPRLVLPLRVILTLILRSRGSWLDTVAQVVPG